MKHKNSTSHGSPVFGQLISLMPRGRVHTIIRQHKADRYTKRFRTWDHLTVMLFAAFSDCGSLRELESGIAGYFTKLLHLGMGWLPKRSTLADANRKRSSEVFEAIYKAIYTKVKDVLPDSYPKNQQWMQRLFLVDSTTITLFKDIMKACGRTPANGKRKGGVKIHIGMHLAESTPSLVCITKAATNDKKFMHKFRDIAPRTILVFDKAYVNYGLYNHWTDQKVTFVTRLHGRSTVEVLQEKTVSPAQQKKGIYREQIVRLGHPGQKEKVKVRLVFFYDKACNRVLKFITNDMKMSASRIAEIYKQRWQIELLFKRMKQNLQLSTFLGDNENAIRIQIWCNLIADLLLTVARKGLKKKIAYSNTAGLVRLHLMNYVKIKDLILNPGDTSIFNKNIIEIQALELQYPP